MPVQRLVLFTQALCLRDELVAEPHLRYIQIRRSVHDAVDAIKQRLLIDPVVAAFGRIVRIKHPVALTTAQERLQKTANLLHTRELVKFLHPHNTNVPEWQLE